MQRQNPTGLFCLNEEKNSLYFSNAGNKVNLKIILIIITINTFGVLEWMIIHLQDRAL